MERGSAIEDREVITNLRHQSCGHPVTWRLSTETTPGGPYCDTCQVRVRDAELVPASGAVCVTFPSRVR